MNFKEWFERQDDVGNILGLEGYASQKAWDYQQAKIDELNKTINQLKQEKLDHINRMNKLLYGDVK